MEKERSGGQGERERERRTERQKERERGGKRRRQGEIENTVHLPACLWKQEKNSLYTPITK